MIILQSILNNILHILPVIDKNNYKFNTVLFNVIYYLSVKSLGSIKHTAETDLLKQPIINRWINLRRCSQ